MVNHASVAIQTNKNKEPGHDYKVVLLIYIQIIPLNNRLQPSYPFFVAETKNLQRLISL